MGTAQKVLDKLQTVPAYEVNEICLAEYIEQISLQSS